MADTEEPAKTVRAFGCVQEDGKSVGWSDTMPVSSCITSSTNVNRLFVDIPVSASTECPEDHMCSIPVLSFEDGVLIAGAIGGVWALGLVARIYVRASQTVMRD